MRGLTEESWINRLVLHVSSLNIQEKAIKAKLYWTEFLLGKVPHPSKYEQHMIPLDRVDRFSYPEMPTNINRYIFRTVDIDTVHSGEEIAYVYTKMCRILLIGFIEVPPPHDWKGTKIHLKSDILGSKHYVLPSGFGDYFIEKANRLIAVQTSMSEKQKK